MVNTYRLKLRIKIEKDNDLITCLTYLKANHAKITYLKLYGDWDNGSVECHFDDMNEIVINDKETAIRAEFFGLTSNIQTIKSEVPELLEVEP